MTTEPTPYLTPDQLHITPDEHAYLIRAADMLAEMCPGKYHQIPDDGLWVFDMCNVAMQTECGTAGCILGLCEHLVRLDNSDAQARPFHWDDKTGRQYSKVLEPLFYPDLVSMRRVTPQDAAKTVRRFLETGVIHFEGHMYWSR